MMLLSAADRFVTEEGLRNVGLVKDDLFASELEPHAFDLVHARYEITPLGRPQAQMETYLRLARAGGTIVLEDPDVASWHFNPPAPALEKLIALIVETFRLSGGDWNAGRNHLHLLREFGIEGDLGPRFCPSAGASVPPPAAAVRHGSRRAVAVTDHRRRAGDSPRAGRGRASDAWPLGHHVHPRAVLGPLPGVTAVGWISTNWSSILGRRRARADLRRRLRQPRSRRRRPALPGLPVRNWSSRTSVASTRASLRPSRNRPTASVRLHPPMRPMSGAKQRA